jgi:hypothetical protein
MISCKRVNASVQLLDPLCDGGGNLRIHVCRFRNVIEGLVWGRGRKHVSHAGEQMRFAVGFARDRRLEQIVIRNLDLEIAAALQDQRRDR